MGEFTIRPAILDDAAAIARVHATSWRETYGRFVEDPDASPWFDVDRRIAMWQENLEGDTHATSVAVHDGAIVGFAAVESTSGPDAVRAEELTMLYLLAGSHGSGAGQALLDAALADRPASLWVAEDNPRAQAFYRRNGFRPDGTTGTFGPIPTTVRMVR
ncbi:GNAT family N-acetyltransferase [Curtobacterium sp. RRHDQ10]|uniref:GNAT family N-acetyltransferase n=1 Tax=Curtobacterium phyllosphaerae TaxID=3413379 RepID=UPI003BF39A7A